MNVESDIVALLKADSTVAGLVGTRIYPELAPQTATLPYLVYQVLSVEPAYAHDGRTEGDRYLISVTSVAEKYTSGKTLAAAVDVALSEKDSTHIQLILKRDEYDNSVFTSSGNDIPLVGIIQDYLVIGA